MAASKPDPRIGVAALIISPSNKILMGKRKGSHGGGKASYLIWNDRYRD